jgi:hypothetical protein
MTRFVNFMGRRDGGGRGTRSVREAFSCGTRERSAWERFATATGDPREVAVANRMPRRAGRARRAPT